MHPWSKFTVYFPATFDTMVSLKSKKFYQKFENRNKPFSIISSIWGLGSHTQNLVQLSLINVSIGKANFRILKIALSHYGSRHDEIHAMPVGAV